MVQEKAVEEEPVVTEEISTEECTEENVQEQPTVVEEQIVPDVEETEVQEEGEITENFSQQESDVAVTEEQSIATSPVPESMPESDAAPERVVESDAAPESVVESDAATVEKEEEEVEIQKQVVREDSSSVVSSSAVPEGIEWPATSEINTSTDAGLPMMKENIQATA